MYAYIFRVFLLEIKLIKSKPTHVAPPQGEIVIDFNGIFARVRPQELDSIQLKL